MVKRAKQGRFLQYCYSILKALQTGRWTGLVSSCPSSVRAAAMKSQTRTPLHTEPYGGGLAGTRGSQTSWLSASQISALTDRFQFHDNHDQREQQNTYNGYPIHEQAAFDAMQAVQPINSSELERHGQGNSILYLNSAFNLIFAHQRPLYFFQTVNSRGVHWISYASEPRLKLIYLLDPLKQRQYTAHYADACTALLQRQNMTHWRLAYLPLKLQQDSHNCGIWCVWLSRQWQEYVMSSSQMPFTQCVERAYQCLPATRFGNVGD